MRAAVVLLSMGALRSLAQNATATLAWDPETNSAVAGYRLYYGTASRTYSAISDAGSSTQKTISNLTNGVTYRFAVTAYDTRGVESDFSAEVSYTAGSTTTNPPQIVLTSPTDGSVFAEPASINLAATVTPNGHTISSVVFYNGASLLQTITSPPYNFTWNNVTAGTYALNARVIYDGGIEGTSAIANVTVGGSRPPPAGTTLTLTMTEQRVPVIQGQGLQNHSYHLETSTNFTTWAGIADVMTDASGHFSFTDSAGLGMPARFYRTHDLSAVQVTLTLITNPGQLTVIQGTGLPNHTYQIRATTDFINWRRVGAVTADANGQFSLMDSGSLLLTVRFYSARDVTP